MQPLRQSHSVFLGGGCVFVAGSHPPRTWTSGSFELFWPLGFFVTWQGFHSIKVRVWIIEKDWFFQTRMVERAAYDWTLLLVVGHEVQFRVLLHFLASILKGHIGESFACVTVVFLFASLVFLVGFNLEWVNLVFYPGSTTGCRRTQHWPDAAGVISQHHHPHHTRLLHPEHPAAKVRL